MTTLLFFDLETTNANPETARIVQGSFFDRSGKLVFVCNPGVPIDPGAVEAHGITDERAAREPRFDESQDGGPSFAAQVQSLIDPNTALVGYNCRRFDTPILHRELQRAGHRGLATDSFGEITQPEIDLLLCWNQLERRTLTGALERFNIDVEDWKAHDAWEDTRVLDPLMRAMMKHFFRTEDDLIQLSNPADMIDRDGKIRRDEDGHPIITFGKHEGKRLSSVPSDYLMWMLNAEFPVSTKAVIKRWLMTGIV